MFTLFIFAITVFALQWYVGECTTRTNVASVQKRDLAPYLEEFTGYLAEEYLLPILFSLFLLHQDTAPALEYVEYAGGLLRAEAFRLGQFGFLLYVYYLIGLSALRTRLPIRLFRVLSKSALLEINYSIRTFTVEFLRELMRNIEPEPGWDSCKTSNYFGSYANAEMVWNSKPYFRSSICGPNGFEKSPNQFASVYQ